MDQYRIPIGTLLHHLDTKFDSVLISNGPNREDITEKWAELEKEKQL